MADAACLAHVALGDGPGEEHGLGSVSGELAELARYGSYLVATHASASGFGLPRRLVLDGRTWYRFMDRIYCPDHPGVLPPRLVAELCELRLELSSVVLDEGVHQRVSSAISAIIDVVCRHREQPPSYVLDFGCGDGRLADNLGRSFPGALVAGCDMSYASLARGPRGRSCQVAAYGPLPFRDAAFDLVVCCFVLHFAVPLRLLRDLGRVTSRGGILVGNVYGDATDNAVARLRAGGWQVYRMVMVDGLPGHEVLVCAPQRRAAGGR